MASISESLNKRQNAWWIALAGMAALFIVATGRMNLQHSQSAGNIAGNTTENITGNFARGYAMRGPSVSVDQARVHSKELVALSTATAVSPPSAPAASTDDRKMVRTSSFDLIVQKPGEAAEKIRGLAEGMGGFLVSSEVSGGADAASGSLTIRVPAARFEEARAAIRKLGLKVEREKVEAQDVTRQYVDQDASLRNLRAEETQYLAILKQAHTVEDTLDVSEKLSAVRGQIEEQQAEFDALSKQIETVAITVSLRTEAEAQVFGLHWRPLYEMKLALRDGLDAVASYGVAMISIVFYLPAVLLWIVTIVVGGAVGWKLLRWVGRVFFAWPKQAAVQNG
jgi:hypothetical protein